MWLWVYAFQYGLFVAQVAWQSYVDHWVGDKRCKEDH